MKTVNGTVEISLSLNVCDLETDATYTDSNGSVRVSNAEQFFADWCENWVNGTGELLGASIESENLDAESEDDED